ncbi:MULTISPECIES: heavy metal translocating P-type ATPase [unclassified Vibrio]|uniref:Copper-exporting P-type ATPase n=2 Tax=Bacteria TaxID=2 RepID=A0AB39HEM6_9VIBR|nr:heavy metal translocating P-type ATPase [Vibrio sp. HB161653]MDP5254238.1 heavy metal translocating P-type ATPase [Vibrio sp. HB161653]
MSNTTLPIHGLHCHQCVDKAKRALERHGIAFSALDKETLTLEERVPLSVLEHTFEEYGYHVGSQKHYRLLGLSCQACVNKLQRQLEKSDKIAVQSLDTDYLKVSTTLSDLELQAMVSELGYQAESITDSSVNDQTHVDTHSSSSPLTQQEPSSRSPSYEKRTTRQETNDLESYYLVIEGMTCASCVASVEKALNHHQGVQKTQVSLAEQSALIYTHSLSDSDKKAIRQSVQQAGYQADFVVHDQLQTAQSQQLFKQKKDYQYGAIAGLATGVPLMLWGALGGSMQVTTASQQWAWGSIGILCFALLATVGRHFFIHAWQAIKFGRTTMDTLVALGTGAAWLYSMCVVIWPGAFPEQSRHLYFEASAMIIGLISLGHYIQTKAKQDTTKSLQQLVQLQPQTALRVTEQGDQEIALKHVALGMHLRVTPGSRVPVDGRIIKGESFFDESMLTGESMPVSKSPGYDVSAGTQNQQGSVIIEATGVGEDTVLANIIARVRQAQSSKPKIAQLVDQVAAVFVPVVIVIALLSALIWWLWGPEPQLNYMMVVATTVLIIACPCALGLATPLSITTAVGKAAQLGILIKDADALQQASKINTVVFDKTGTLTQGKPQVQDFVTAQSHAQQEVLALFYGLEQGSEHPLAQAICQFSQQKKVLAADVEQFESVTGQGVKGQYHQQVALLGSLDFLKQHAIDCQEFSDSIRTYQQQAWTPIGLALDGHMVGLVGVADTIKPDAKQTISHLKQLGINTVMLTGDDHYVATRVGEQLGIDTVVAHVLPEQKYDYLVQYQQQGQRVAMVGDGINDAPALAQADMGIAMGNGSDIAISTAHMTLLKSSPYALIEAIALSKATMKNIKQNLVGAFLYNCLGIPVAAGILYPLWGVLLNPVVAGSAMALSSITVVLNAHRLKHFTS